MSNNIHTCIWQYIVLTLIVRVKLILFYQASRALVHLINFKLFEIQALLILTIIRISLNMPMILIQFHFQSLLTVPLTCFNPNAGPANLAQLKCSNLKPTLARQSWLCPYGSVSQGREKWPSRQMAILPVKKKCKRKLFLYFPKKGT